MVIRSRRPAPLATVTACSLRVAGVIQTIMHNAVLHGDKMAVVGVHILLGGPSELTMVDDVLRAILCPESVLRNDIAVDIIAADTETDIADDLGLRAATIDVVVRYDDTHTRCCLPGNGVVLAVDTQVLDQTYLAGNRKAHGQRFIRILFHCPTQ